MEDASAVRKRLLLTALESGSTNAKILALLRKWAKEGRPYKGHIFQPEEVEDAINSISSSQAACKPAPELVPTPSRAPHHGSTTADIDKSDTSSSGCASYVPNRCVMVNTKSSRPQKVLESAVAVARSLAEGPDENTVAKDGGCRERSLQSLYELGTGQQSGRVRHADFKIDVSRSASVGAHKDVLLAMMSDAAKNADEVIKSIDGSQFGFVAVSVAVEFAYRGMCKVPIGDLVKLLAFADFVQWPELLDALDRSLASLPVVRSIEVLASLDQRSVIASEMLNRANILLQTSAKTFIGVAEVFNKTVTVGLTVAMRSDDRVSQCWAFVDALHDVLRQLSIEATERLKRWISLESQPLCSAVERFMVEAIRAASNAAAAGVEASDLTCICKRPFKSWLPEDQISKIVREVADRDGFVRHVNGAKGLVSSQPHRWLQWTFSGGPSLAAMWTIYNLVKDLVEENARSGTTVSETAEGTIGNAESQGMGAEGRMVTLGLPHMLARNFGAAFIEEVYQNPSSANSWGVLQQGLDEGLDTAEESLRVLVRHVRRGKNLPPGLPPRMMSIVLRETLVDASASAYRVSGPPSIAGIFERCRGSKIEFRRKASEGPELVLRRVVRTSGRDAISIVYPGITLEECRRATAEWKIQKADDDEKFDCPLAVALTAHQDPCNLDVCWRFCAAGGKFRGQFKEDNSIEVELESVQADEASVCQGVLTAWVREGGCLNQLMDDVQAKSASGPVLLMCHEVAKSIAPVEPSDGGGQSTQRIDELAREAEVGDTTLEVQTHDKKEENDATWKDAFLVFKPLAADLIQVLSAICDTQTASELRHHLKRKREVEESEAYIKAIRLLEETREN